MRETNLNHRMRQYMDETREHPLPPRIVCRCGRRIEPEARVEDLSHGRLCLACQNRACGRMLEEVLAAEPVDPAEHAKRQMVILRVEHAKRMAALRRRPWWDGLLILGAILLGVLLAMAGRWVMSWF